MKAVSYGADDENRTREPHPYQWRKILITQGKTSSTRLNFILYFLYHVCGIREGIYQVHFLSSVDQLQQKGLEGFLPQGLLLCGSG